MKLFIHTGYYVVLLVLVLLTGCAKNDLSLAEMDALRTGNSGNDDARINEYLVKHNIEAVRDPSGLYYKILYFGDSLSVMQPTSIPTLAYTNKLLNDKVVASSFGGIDFDGRQLKDHILGWQIGLRKISKGGSILLFIPSALAFGPQSIGNLIPANSILISEVELIDFK
ncbi:FKBP-type peptidyl-prolyl cis-trans isomerase [Chitinophaga defluvii]|uniref:Peptidyl-prolyl cis-trans isomerase n=1 Tax=Chitinophaga defluvii TaxID=3163343 RepID=A0ABV2SZI5_9BACT